MAFNGKAPYAPNYASYDWVGAPANYDLSTNTDLGGDSRMCLSWDPEQYQSQYQSLTFLLI